MKPENEIGFEPVIDIKPFFFDEDAFRLQPYFVSRVAFGSGRAYYRWIKEGDEEVLHLYASLTTTIAQSLPTPPQLLDWYIDLGKEEAKRYSETAASYGSLLHDLIAKYSVSHKFNFSRSNIEKIISNWCSEQDFYQPECNSKWPRALQEDMAAWIQFERDVELKVIAVELILTSKLGFGTAIDIVGDAWIEEKGFFGETLKTGPNAGMPKETKRKVKKRILINMKSGRKGIYESHIIQLEFEKRIFEENFPEIKIDAVYNWAPKDWKNDSPSYVFPDQTGKVSDVTFNAILALAKERFTDTLPDRKYTSIFGEYSQGSDLANNIKQSTLIEKLTALRIKQLEPIIYATGDE